MELTKDAPTKKGVDDSANQEGQGRSNCARTTEIKKQGRSDNNTKDKFHCMLHGPNPTHNTKNCCNLKKHVDKLKNENPCRNGSHKTQEEMNTVFNYVQKKMADKRKRVDRNRSNRKQELNKFSDMSLEQKATMDVED